MSGLAPAPQSKQKSGKRPKSRKPWPKLAEQHGVNVRTLDRWVDAGIIDAPEYINGRKYGDPDAAPRLDVANSSSSPEAA
jgi:hypothetical protein